MHLSLYYYRVVSKLRLINQYMLVLFSAFFVKTSFNVHEWYIGCRMENFERMTVFVMCSSTLVPHLKVWSYLHIISPTACELNHCCRQFITLVIYIKKLNPLTTLAVTATRINFISFTFQEFTQCGLLLAKLEYSCSSLGQKVIKKIYFILIWFMCWILV